MLLNFIRLLVLTGGLERRMRAPVIKQLAYLWRDGLSDEMPIHFPQLIVDHPSQLGARNIHELIMACLSHQFPGTSGRTWLRKRAIGNGSRVADRCGIGLTESAQ
jgi:hypothetical protein